MRLPNPTISAESIANGPKELSVFQATFGGSFVEEIGILLGCLVLLVLIVVVYKKRSKK